MSQTALRYVNLLKTSLCLAGPFAFIAAVLFRPRMLTPYMSGVGNMVPVELQTLAVVGLLLVTCIAVRPARWGHPVAWSVAGGVAVPAACALLVIRVQDVLVAPIVACGLAVASAVILRGTLVQLPFARSSTLADYGLSAIVSLCISSLLSHIGYVTSVNDAYGTVGLALQVALSGLLMAWFVGRCGSQGEEQPDTSAVPGADMSSPDTAQLRTARSLRDKAAVALRVVGPVAPAGLICSLSLGLSVFNASLESMMRLSTPFILGSLMAVVALTLLALRWWWRSEELDGEIVLFMTVPCAFALAASVLAGLLDFSLVFALLTCSNLMFLTLLWVDMLYLAGRRLFAFSAAPLAALMIVLMLFCLGMIATGMLPANIVDRVVPLGAVAYLVYLVFHFHGTAERPPWEEAARAPEEGSAERQLSYDEIRLAACRALSDDFALSPKESEVLPLLVMGLSAASIGRQLFISHETVKTHKYHIYQKLGVHNYEEALEVFRRYANGELAEG